MCKYLEPDFVEGMHHLILTTRKKSSHSEQLKFFYLSLPPRPQGRHCPHPWAGWPYTNSRAQVRAQVIETDSAEFYIAQYTVIHTDGDRVKGEDEEANLNDVGYDDIGVCRKSLSR